MMALRAKPALPPREKTKVTGHVKQAMPRGISWHKKRLDLLLPLYRKEKVEAYEPGVREKVASLEFDQLVASQTFCDNGHQLAKGGASNRCIRALGGAIIITESQAHSISTLVALYSTTLASHD
jgi:hypothetical protein